MRSHEQLTEAAVRLAKVQQRQFQENRSFNETIHLQVTPDEFAMLLRESFRSTASVDRNSVGWPRFCGFLLWVDFQRT